MTSSQRFKETMQFGCPDRVPYFEEGIRDDVLKAWRRQGLPRKTKLSDLFAADPFEQILLDVDPIPEYKVWPSSVSELDEFKKRLNPEDPRRFPKTWKKQMQGWQKNDQVLFARVHRGFFLTMGVYKWQRFDELMSLVVEHPDFVKQMMKIQGEFSAELLDKMLNGIKIDAAIFSEPIGGNFGPLISPAMYEYFVLQSYKPLFEVLDRQGIETVIFRTYANARLYIPVILKFGFNCLWACETTIEQMDYRSIRREFGRDLRLIGGIDLDVLRLDKEAIRREVEEKVPPLLAEGGYVPLADGRVRKDIPFENYAYYRRLLETYTS